MKARMIFHIICILVISNSCMKDEMLWTSGKEIERIPISGVFIANEGNFMYGNASLSFYDPASGETLNDIFFETNGIPLGDIAQSITIRDSLAYLVMNNSGKIQVMNIHSFEFIGKITGLTSPRYIHFVDSSKAYVTDLYARAISIVDPRTLEITGQIPVSNHQSGFYQHATEQMVQYDRFVFTNCWSYDNQLLVIDTETDKLIDSIQVLKQPAALVIDRFNKIWTLTDGGFEGSPYGYEAPGLIRINAITREVERIIRFEPGDHPSDLALNGSGDTLYFINSDVYRMPVLSEDLPGLFLTSPYTENDIGGFSALGVDPYTSEVYLADAANHIQPGKIYRITPDGIPVDTFTVGIIPGSLVFKPSE